MATGPDIKSQELFQNSPCWCPGWEAVPDTSVPGGKWLQVTGYSMNYMVSLSPTHPQINNPATPANGVPFSEYLNIQLSASGAIVPASGTWYKLGRQKGNSSQPLVSGRLRIAGSSVGSLELARADSVQPPVAASASGETPGVQERFDADRHPGSNHIRLVSSRRLPQPAGHLVRRSVGVVHGTGFRASWRQSFLQHSLFRRTRCHQQ